MGDVMAEVMGLVLSCGRDLRAAIDAAIEKGPAWVVFIGDLERIDLREAPLEVVLRAIDAGATTRVLSVALPVARLAGALGDVEAEAEVRHAIREIRDDGRCACVVATSSRMMAVPLGSPSLGTM